MSLSAKGYDHLLVMCGCIKLFVLSLQVVGLVEKPVGCVEDVLQLIQLGNNCR